MAFFSTTPTAAPAPRDIEVADPPSDSISSLAFSSQADYLAAGSWDNSVRIYEVASNGQTQGKAMYSHEGPVLSVCWNKDGTKILSGGADGAGRMFNVTTGQTSQVAQHDAPVKAVKWIESPQGGILATGSWDKTIKFWDLRSPTAMFSINLPERVYTMDVLYPYMVVGTAERHVQIFNLSNPTTPWKTFASPLKWQTRAVACFGAGPPGFAIGSIEGRIAVQFFEESEAAKNFSFRCHRRDQSNTAKDQSLVYAVNDLSFHPVHGTLASCGSDGVINYWDKDSRIRLKAFDPVAGSITTTSFNRTGTLLAYAISYDWSRGHVGMTSGYPNKVMLRAVSDEDVKRKPPRK